MGLDVDLFGKRNNQKIIIDYIDDYLKCYDTLLCFEYSFALLNCDIALSFYPYLKKNEKYEILFNLFCSNRLSILIKWSL